MEKRKLASRSQEQPKSKGGKKKRCRRSAYTVDDTHAPQAGSHLKPKRGRPAATAASGPHREVRNSISNVAERRVKLPKLHLAVYHRGMGA